MWPGAAGDHHDGHELNLGRGTSADMATAGCRLTGAGKRTSHLPGASAKDQNPRRHVSPRRLGSACVTGRLAQARRRRSRRGDSTQRRPDWRDGEACEALANGLRGAPPAPGRRCRLPGCRRPRDASQNHRASQRPTLRHTDRRARSAAGAGAWRVWSRAGSRAVRATCRWPSEVSPKLDLSPGLLLRGTRNDRRVRLPQLVTAGLRVGGGDGMASLARRRCAADEGLQQLWLKRGWGYARAQCSRSPRSCRRRWC